MGSWLFTVQTCAWIHVWFVQWRASNLLSFALIKHFVWNSLTSSWIALIWPKLHGPDPLLWSSFNWTCFRWLMTATMTRYQIVLPQNYLIAQTDQAKMFCPIWTNWKDSGRIVVLTLRAQTISVFVTDDDLYCAACFHLAWTITFQWLINVWKKQVMTWPA